MTDSATDLKFYFNQGTKKVIKKDEAIDKLLAI